MSYFSEKLKEAIDSSGLSQGKIADTIGELRSNFNAFVNGKRALTDDKIQKMVSIPELKLDFMTLKSWQALDQYGPDVLKKAFQLLKEKGD